MSKKVHTSGSCYVRKPKSRLPPKKLISVQTSVQHKDIQGLPFSLINFSSNYVLHGKCSLCFSFLSAIHLIVTARKPTWEWQWTHFREIWNRLENTNKTWDENSLWCQHNFQIHGLHLLKKQIYTYVMLLSLTFNVQRVGTRSIFN